LPAAHTEFPKRLSAPNQCLFIDDAAAVGVDQAAQQPARVSLDDQLLPWLQLDPALVLDPGAVLGEEVGPVL